MFRTYVTSSMLLIAATVLALVIANTSMSATYFEFWNQRSASRWATSTFSATEVTR